VALRKKTKADAIDAFFADISTRGQIPVLGTMEGRLRFDVSGTRGVEYWYVTLHNGEASVSHKNTKADVVVRIAQDLFGEIVEGRKNAMAALLRGAMEAEGDFRILIAFGRLFPGRHGSKGRVAPILEVDQQR